jgi:choline dehydrogenase-like flavoprotein
MKRIEGDFDYIIVGAGTAGCIVANRLSADPSKRVLILEAGGDDNWIWFHIPVGYLFAIGNPRSDWMFKTEPEVGLNGRALAYPRGKVIGGSSAINAMISMRGQAADYDHWRQRGLLAQHTMSAGLQAAGGLLLGERAPWHARGWRISAAARPFSTRSAKAQEWGSKDPRLQHRQQ